MKNKEKVLNIFKEILKQAREEGYSVGITKLVKLLYLLEVEYYRLYQKRLTDLEWKFFHYGPYAPEIEEILKSPDIDQEEIDISDERIFRKLLVAKDRYKKYSAEPGFIRLITRIVNEWGGADLRSLLDYVYFETEPMQDVERGEILDFSEIKPWHVERIKKIKVNQKRLHEIRKHINEHIKDVKRPIIKVKADNILSECLKIWDEDSKDIRITGDVIISTEEANDK